MTRTILITAIALGSIGMQGQVKPAPPKSETVMDAGRYSRKTMPNILLTPNTETKLFVNAPYYVEPAMICKGAETVSDCKIQDGHTLDEAVNAIMNAYRNQLAAKDSKLRAYEEYHQTMLHIFAEMQSKKNPTK